MNPARKVPTVVLNDGSIINESLIICDFLDEKFPEPRLYPGDPVQKAKDRMMVERFTKVGFVIE